MTPVNAAAWLRTWHGRPEAGPAPYTPPGENEIVVRNHAVAVNPIDGLPAIARRLVLPWLGYPAVLGTDVDGEVVETGSAITRFAAGDRVLGHALGFERSNNRAAEGAFQLYTVLSGHMAAPIPDQISFDRAAVLPLGLSTAASGLFERPVLGLELPAASPASTGQTVLVWGGSTSVGSNAIQLAVNAGYDVVTTASPRNFAYARRLGAGEVFDYHSDTAVKDIIRFLAQVPPLAGAIAIGRGSARACMDIVDAVPGAKTLASASPSVATATQRPRARRRGIRVKSIWGSSLKDNEVGPAIYRQFLPRALSAGAYVPAPDPLVAGHGLEHIQTALDALKRGVSARKVVITL